MAMREFFITGVGTGIGKTLVTTILCHQFARSGRRVIALKPLVSGFDPEDPDSDPARILRSLGRSPSPDAITSIAPWRFRSPVSPHLAARRERASVSISEMAAFCQGHQRDSIDIL